MLTRLQDVLDFKGWSNPQFASKNGLGRVGLSAWLLGVCLGVHACLLVKGAGGWWEELSSVLPSLSPSIWLRWNAYVASLALFHFSEFFVTALFKPDVLTYDSFVINHSKAYTVAQLSCMAEFWIESILFPSLKQYNRLALAGIAISLLGHSLRVLAMWVCGKNFNHIIMQEREANHELVTHGIYSLLRHPSYTGWFWWTIGGQVILGNPVCLLGFYAASLLFFADRITYEERLLCSFYPDQYPAYVRRTYLGMPLIDVLMRIKKRGEGRIDKSS